MKTILFSPSCPRLKVPRTVGLLSIALAMFLGCAKKGPDFAPQVNPGATYSFSITDNGGYGAKVQYNLTDITQVATKNGGADGWKYSTFMLKGKDKASNADVYITGKINYYDSYLNIAIVKGATTTFYKDCNNFYCRADTGSNSQGKFLRLSNFSSTCITTTLDSERRMSITTYRALLNPLTFYIQED